MLTAGRKSFQEKGTAGTMKPDVKGERDPRDVRDQRLGQRGYQGSQSLGLRINPRGRSGKSGFNIYNIFIHIHQNTDNKGVSKEPATKPERALSHLEGGSS